MLRLISLRSYKTQHKTVTFSVSKIRLSNLVVGINMNIALSCLDVSGLGVIKSS
jgi:hypothetical protein